MTKHARVESQVGALAKAISIAFAASSLTQEERSPRQIEFTDLPWTVPPLTSNLLLGQAELQSYLDTPITVRGSALTNFWRATLDLMYLSPSRLIKNGSHSTARGTLSYTKPGVRAFRFSTPAGYPGMLSPDAGVMFSLEVAHTAMISMPVIDLVKNESNYYVVLADGESIGVKDGRPINADQWDFNASGMVLDLLEMPRGLSSQECLYDQIASARSLLHVHSDKFQQDFQALDYALQALRFLTLGASCPELVTYTQVAPQNLRQAREKVAAVRDALQTMSMDMADKYKLQSIEAVLVPLVMNVTTFRRTIFASPHYPFTMEAGRTEKIQTVLASLLEELQCKAGPTA